MMADITKSADLIPDKYLQTHDYEDRDSGSPVIKYELYMPDGRIPLDLAFCRWMACEKGVVMMPNSFFYNKGSPELCDRYVRMAICKDNISTKAAIDKLASALNQTPKL